MKLLMVLIMLSFISLLGCARTYTYYEFESEIKKVATLGEIGVSLSGTYRNINDGFFSKETILGNPYHLVISFVPDVEQLGICLKRVVYIQNDRKTEIINDKLLCEDISSGHAGKYPNGVQAYGFKDVVLDYDMPVEIEIDYQTLDKTYSDTISIEIKNLPTRKEKGNDILDMINSA